MSIQNGTSLTKEALEYLVRLIRDISGLDSKLIDDINLKTNGTYSSVRIKSLIDKNLEEANKHTEDLISALNKLSSKKTNVQPTLDNSEFNVIYLYSTDGNAPFEQYLKIGTNDSDAELISLGSTNISLDEYLTVLEASQTYAKQVDLNTTNNTLSNHINNTDAHLTEERVTEVIKSKIATTIDSTSTKEELASAKDVYDKLSNKLDNTIELKTADEVNSFDKVYQSFIIQPSVADEIGLPSLPSSWWFCIHFSHSKGYKYPSQIAFEYAGFKRIMYRTSVNGVWGSWQRVCTTSVADVPVTNISMSSTYTNNPNCKYQVVNGICYIDFMSGTYKLTSNVNGVILATGLPIPRTGQVCTTYVPWSCADASKQVILFVNGNGELILHASVNANATPMFCTFSYPVAES